MIGSPWYIPPKPTTDLLYRKTSDLTITSLSTGTTYTDIPDLEDIPIPVGSWVVSWSVLWAAHATPDIKMRIVGTNVTGVWSLLDDRTNSSDTNFSTGSQAMAYGSGTTVVKRVLLEAIVTAASAGTLSLQGAQNTSSTEQTIFKAGSWARRSRFE